MMASHPLFDVPESKTDVKERIKNLTPTEFDSLKSAERYLKIVRPIKRDAWLNIFLGGLTLWLGVSNINQGLPRIIQSVLGAIIILQCISVLYKPSVPSLMRFSVVFLVSGVWNLIVASINNFAGFSTFIAFLGGMQIWWAYGFARIYEREKDKRFIAPAAQIVQFYDNLLAELRAIRQKSDEDAIDISLKRYQWYGWLLGDYAFFVPRNNRRNLIIARKSDVNFAPRNEQQLSRRRINGIFKIDDLVAWSDVRSDTLERYQQWKDVDSPDADFVKTYYEQQRTPLLISKIFRGFTILFLFGVVLIVGWLIWLVIQYG